MDLGPEMHVFIVEAIKEYLERYGFEKTAECLKVKKN